MNTNDSNVFFCHWDFLRYLSETEMQNEDGSYKTISLTERKWFELMIFLGKNIITSEFEVEVFKEKETDNYVPNKKDNVKRYEENSQYASFFFDKFQAAIDFIKSIWLHPEYSKRPVREILQ